MTLQKITTHPLVSTVMIVDDQLTSRVILETIVQGICDNVIVRTFDNAVSALKIAEADPPDLIIADYKMPELDGVEFTRKIRQIPACEDVPVVIITIIDDRSVMYEALEAGATDFLTKPLDHYEYKARCRNLLTIRRQQLIIRNRAENLEAQIKAATRAIHTREKETLIRLARAGEFKDSLTGTHLNRISRISRLIAEQLGMDEAFCETIEISAPMHDIGKIGIPDRVLLKEGPLDDEELKVMKTHTTIGYEILKDSPSHYLQMGAVIALNHHERFDGNGYPFGLKGEDIPIEARIVAIADMFDALTSQRSYKLAWPIESALDEINAQRNKHLDPDCVEALFAQLDNIVSQQQKLSSSPN